MTPASRLSSSPRGRLATDRGCRSARWARGRSSTTDRNGGRDPRFYGALVSEIESLAGAIASPAPAPAAGAAIGAVAALVGRARREGVRVDVRTVSLAAEGASAAAARAAALAFAEIDERAFGGHLARAPGGSRCRGRLGRGGARPARPRRGLRCARGPRSVGRRAREPEPARRDRQRDPAGTRGRPRSGPARRDRSRVRRRRLRRRPRTARGGARQAVVAGRGSDAQATRRSCEVRSPRNSSTRFGSNCVPAPSSSSRRASTASSASRYGRSASIAS